MLFSLCLRHLFPCHKRGAVSYADVQSANICGYHTYDLIKGYNLYAPNFEGIGKALDVQQVRLSGNITSSADYICIINENGISTGFYAWFEKNDSGFDADGWVDDHDGNWELWSHEITEGEGIYLKTEKAGVKVTTSGQVKLGSYTRTLKKGYTVVGNCSPVDIDIQDFRLSGNITSSADYICIINENGVSTGFYAWFDKNDSGFEADGWVDDHDGNWELWNKTLLAGEGVYLKCEKDGVIVTFPGALGE